MRLLGDEIWRIKLKRQIKKSMDDLKDFKRKTNDC